MKVRIRQFAGYACAGCGKDHGDFIPDDGCGRCGCITAERVYDYTEVEKVKRVEVIVPRSQDFLIAERYISGMVARAKDSLEAIFDEIQAEFDRRFESYPKYTQLRMEYEKDPFLAALH